jgi:MYXO-CTERM domain-containing protein
VTTTHDVARGSLYTCDQGQNDCDYFDSLEFGSQVESLPALVLSPGSGADDTARGQLLYRLMHPAPDGSLHWGSWRVAQHMPSEEVRFAAAQSEYCADIEIRSLLLDGGVTAATPCLAHGSLQAPLIADTDIDAKLLSCQRPPSGLEPEWCAVHETDCASPSSPVCDEVTQRCVDPVARGPVSSASEGTGVPSIELAEQCPSPADPYDESVAGCTCRMSETRAPGAPLGLVLFAVPWWFRRRATGNRRVKPDSLSQRH